MPGERRSKSDKPSKAPGGVGLLLIDVINDMGFQGGDALLAGATAPVLVLRELRLPADRLGVPVIYVNDYTGGRRGARIRRADDQAMDRGSRHGHAHRTVTQQR